MIKKNLIKFITFFFILINFECNANIKNNILVKVGNEIITSIDLENEIRLILFLSKIEVSQQNINEARPQAMQSLIRRFIKKEEINNYTIETNSNEVSNYIKNVSNNFGVKRTKLKDLFKENNVDYDYFLERAEIEFLWKQLIFLIYKNQTNINMIEVENEIKTALKNTLETTEYNISEIELIYNEGTNEKNIRDTMASIKENGFEATAKKLSVSNSSINGGLLGWINEKTLSDLYKNEISIIKKDQVTRPIKNNESIVILKLNEIKKIDNNEVDLEKIKKNIMNRKKEEKLNLFSRSHYSKIERSTMVTYN